MAFRERAVCSGGKLEAWLMVLAWQDEMRNRKWDLTHWGPLGLRKMWAEQDSAGKRWEWGI